MLRRPIALALAACVLALTACGGSSRSATARPVDDPMVEEHPAIEHAPSGIAGLTSAEVAAMPEAPALPSRFGVASTEDEVRAEAERVAERESKRKQLGDLSADKRALFLTHEWWQAVRTLQRGEPSRIPGLTQGELEDQPAVPPLPELFDLTHDAEDLRNHAFLLASEEFESGIIGENLIAGRTTYLVWAWTPLLEARQERYREALAERKVRHDYQVSDARREAEWEANLKEHRRETERLMVIERHKTIPVLTPEEQAELDSITGD